MAWVLQSLLAYRCLCAIYSQCVSAWRLMLAGRQIICMDKATQMHSWHMNQIIQMYLAQNVSWKTG